MRLFPDREIYMRSNGQVRFLRLSTELQLKIAGVVLFLMLAAVGLAAGTLAMGLEVERQRAALGQKAEMVQKTAGKVAVFQSSIDDVADRIEVRQERLDALVRHYFGTIDGKSGPVAINGTKPAPARLTAVEREQIEFAAALNVAAAERVQTAETTLRKLGIDPRAIAGKSRPTAVGGPFLPLDEDDADARLAELDASLNRLDRLERAILAVPAQMPARPMSLTSRFGARSDPFNGRRAFHAGLDIRGRHGQPIYATAAGRVVSVGARSGYGKMVVIDHGHGLETRYAHLSGYTVSSGQIVKPGQQIARMGSTGRSTGTHLHYEVRLNGRVLNPHSFLEASSHVREIQAQAGSRIANKLKRT